MSLEPAIFPRWRRRAWIVAAAGGVLCLLGLIFSRTQFCRSYWFAWVFWACAGFGGLPLVTMHFMTGGRWGAVARRPAEAATMTLPLLALLFLPALFGFSAIFPWARGEYAHPSPHKQQYLTEGGFLLRTAIYFAVLVPAAYLLRSYSRAGQGKVSRLDAAIRGGIGGGGAVAYVLCMTFASTDWVMSLEPEWFSTIFSIIFMASQLLVTLALSVLIVTAFSSHYAPLLTRLTLRDLGNLLLAFVIFWAYVSFSQFLIIWAGNLPREISWYLHRRAGAWPAVAGLLAVLQFGLPFALLLSRASKHHPRALASIAALIFAAGILNVFWIVIPSFSPHGVSLHWLDVAAFVAIGGAWLATFLGALEAQPLIVREEVPDE